MESIKRRLVTGAVWLGASRILINLAGFASTILLARFLTPADFGLVAIATSLLAVVMSLTELSLSSALIHHKEPTQDHFHSAWTIALVRALLVTGIFAIAAYPMARIYDDSRLALVVIITGFTGAVSGMANPKAVLLAKELVFWPEFFVRVSQRVLILVVALPLAYYYRTYWSIVLASAAGTFLSVGLSYFVMPYSPKINLAHFKELFKFSIWLSLGQAVNTLNWRFDQFVIGYFIGKPALGVYSVADNLSAIPTREATTPFSQTLFPAFVKLVNDPARLRKAYLLAQSTLCSVALPVGFGFALIAQPMILLVMGEKWLGAVPIIQILAGTFALQTLSGTTLQPLAMALGDTKTLFRRDLLIFAWRIPFILIGLHFGGLLGIVYARSVSSFIGILLNMSLVKKLADISTFEQFKVNTRSLLAVISMVVVARYINHTAEWGTDRWSLATQIIAIITGSGLIYLSVMFLLWIAAGRPEGLEAEIGRLVRKVKNSVLNKHFGKQNTRI